VKQIDGEGILTGHCRTLIGGQRGTLVRLLRLANRDGESQYRRQKNADSQ
jgi:hypothetical protein